MSTYLHGENGITYALFTALDDIDKMNYFLKFITYHPSTSKLKEEYSWPEIHVFPSFGRKNGIGEPDVMILHGTNLFVVEVETASHAKGGLPHNFYDQFQRFIDLGITLERDKSSGRKKMGKNPVAVANTEKYFKGEFRTRKFYQTLMARGIQQYYYILISNDHKDYIEKNVNQIYSKFTFEGNHHFGWIGLNSVKRFTCFDDNTKQMIQETIDYNLK